MAGRTLAGVRKLEITMLLIAGWGMALLVLIAYCAVQRPARTFVAGAVLGSIPGGTGVTWLLGATLGLGEFGQAVLVYAPIGLLLGGYVGVAAAALLVPPPGRRLGALVGGLTGAVLGFATLLLWRELVYDWEALAFDRNHPTLVETFAIGSGTLLGTLAGAQIGALRPGWRPARVRKRTAGPWRRLPSPLPDPDVPGSVQDKKRLEHDPGED